MGRLFKVDIGGTSSFSIKRLAFVLGTVFALIVPNTVIFLFRHTADVNQLLSNWFTFYTFFINIIVGGYYGGKYIDNHFSVKHKQIENGNHKLPDDMPPGGVQ